MRLRNKYRVKYREIAYLFLVITCSIIWDFYLGRFGEKRIRKELRPLWYLLTFGVTWWVLMTYVVSPILDKWFSYVITPINHALWA